MRSTQLPDARETLNEIVQRHPQALPVLHRHGFDTCCGGALPLEEVARRHGVELEPLLRELRDATA